MATGANTTPLGRLHPVLAARVAESESFSLGNGKKNPELEAQIEAAKRAASALFPQGTISSPQPITFHRETSVGVHVCVSLK